MKLVEPSVPGAAWTTSPATVWETTECHVDVAPQSLMGRSILGEPGYVTKQSAATTTSHSKTSYKCSRIKSFSSRLAKPETAPQIELR